MTYRPSNKSILWRLKERDGPNCFYCNAGLWTEFQGASGAYGGWSREATVEHMLAQDVARKCRESQTCEAIENLVIACRNCNTRAGHLSIAEKVRLRDQIRRDQRKEAAA